MCVLRYGRRGRRGWRDVQMWRSVALWSGRHRGRVRRRWGERRTEDGRLGGVGEGRSRVAKRGVGWSPETIRLAWRDLAREDASRRSGRRVASVRRMEYWRLTRMLSKGVSGFDPVI